VVEKRIEIRWRDMDALGHVNNAVYATYFEEIRDEWTEHVLGGHTPWTSFVLARIAIDFRRELSQADDVIVVRCRLTRIGTSSLTLREEISTLDGTLAAECEAVVVVRDPEAGRSRPFTPLERGALERALAGDAAA
jgi:acyl-CoA thioester hydrolase